MTRPVKPRNVPIRTAANKIFERPGNGDETGCTEAASESVGAPCQKKSATKSEIADQIGLQLRSIYDDVLAQPVPGRFLDLLRQLESTSRSGLSKDRM
ncbi:MAG: hypothetical protein L0Y50_04150 [Beijerinckiaceae bacterium]|nr:hypothetical protein [Beijerinckiaceae bacterium]MCI0735453.1 hypothetical protein [Beijerinckiaceae bacterium]